VKLVVDFRAAEGRHNDLSPRRVLVHGIKHVMAPDERRRRLASTVLILRPTWVKRFTVDKLNGPTVSTAIQSVSQSVSQSVERLTGHGP